MGRTRRNPLWDASRGCGWVAWAAETADAKRSLLQKLVRRIALGQKTLTVDINCGALSEHLLDNALPSDGGAKTTSITCPFDIKRRGVEMRIVLSDASAGSSEPHAALIHVVHRLQMYLHQLTDGSGRSLTEIAKLNATTICEVSRLLPRAFLSPKIMSKIIAGNQPTELTAHRLSRLSGLPLAWADQAALLGL